LLDSVIGEADRHYPDETGGILLGYWVNGGKDTVITTLTGPGPRAVHRRNSFTPDYFYQEQRIADGYTTSGRRHTYLGDWHTHPDCSTAELSWKDRRALAEIAVYPEARNRSPVMAIAAGTPASWITTFWKGELRRVGNRLLGVRANLLSLEIV
jgi:integrative and conjugative element protein (TIGR02256 family)